MEVTIMGAKRKKPENGEKPEPKQPEPQSLDELAQELNRQIDSGETAAAVAHWRLGDCLTEIREKHAEWKWDDWKAHAETLGINKSRFTRSLRIRRHFPDGENQVVGKSIYEALGYKRGDDEPVPEEKEPEYEDENAPLTSREQHAGQRFIEAVGSPNRAAVVLACIVRGDKPVKKAAAQLWLPAWEEVKQHRDELRKYTGEGDLYRAFQSRYRADDIPSYRHVKADPVTALSRFREIRASCYELAQKRRAEQAAGYGEVAAATMRALHDLLVADSTPAGPADAASVDRKSVV
jgi:hypothetical protein